MGFKIQTDGNEEVKYTYPSIGLFRATGKISSCPDYRFPGHWHGAVELSLMVKGDMQYDINGKQVTVREGEGIFINSRQVHANYSENKTECEYICILADPEKLCTDSHFERDLVMPVTGAEAPAYIIMSPETPWQKKICRYIRKIYDTPDTRGTELQLQSFVYGIWYQLLEHTFEEEKEKSRSGELETVRGMLSYISRNYSENVKLKDIAAAGFVSESKCCRLFRRYIKSSPGEYLNQYRLSKSRELLSEELTVTQVAERAGFGGASYFTECFRKQYGETPSEYRRRNTVHNSAVDGGSKIN